MVLEKYFFKRFFLYLFFINFLLALLFNFVEFFEKLTRAKLATSSSILHFLMLNFIPSFFDLMQLATWLAACLVIKEFYQHGEWDALQILSIGKRKVFALFLSVGVIIGVGNFICKEWFVLPIAFKAERFKLETFKQRSIQKILSKWLILDDHTFCYFNVIDLENSIGEGLLLIFMRPDFSIDHIISAQTFIIDQSKQEILMTDARLFCAQENSMNKITCNRLMLPGFFSQLRLNLEVPSFINQTHYLIMHGRYLPTSLCDDLKKQIFQRLGGYLQLVLYPVMTYCCFAMIPGLALVQFSMMLVPYPLMVFVAHGASFLAACGGIPSILLLPYLLLVLILIICYRRI